MKRGEERFSPDVAIRKHLFPSRSVSHDNVTAVGGNVTLRQVRQPSPREIAEYLQHGAQTQSEEQSPTPEEIVELIVSILGRCVAANILDQWSRTNVLRTFYKENVFLTEKYRVFVSSLEKFLAANSDAVSIVPNNVQRDGTIRKGRKVFGE